MFSDHAKERATLRFCFERAAAKSSTPERLGDTIGKSLQSRWLIRVTMCLVVAGAQFRTTGVRHSLAFQASIVVNRNLNLNLNLTEYFASREQARYFTSGETAVSFESVVLSSTG